MLNVDTDTISDNIHCTDLTCHINYHINSDSSYHINSDMINIYNLSSAFCKTNSHINFNFHKHCLNFVNMIFMCFMQNFNSSSML